MKNNELPKDTIIYGGAFNPPTRAHQAILQACVDYAESRTEQTDIWLLPSGNRSDKTIETTHADRLRMLDILIADVIKRTVIIDVETSELYQTVQTETYDTVQRFKETYPDRRFIWVYGSDSVKTMPQWDNGDKLLDEPMLIVERPGTPIEKLAQHAIRLPVDAIEVSSTQVRTRLEKGEDIQHLVSPSINELLHSR